MNTLSKVKYYYEYTLDDLADSTYNITINTIKARNVYENEWALEDTNKSEPKPQNEEAKNNLVTTKLHKSKTKKGVLCLNTASLRQLSRLRDDFKVSVYDYQQKSFRFLNVIIPGHLVVDTGIIVFSSHNIFLCNKFTKLSTFVFFPEELQKIFRAQEYFFSFGLPRVPSNQASNTVNGNTL